MENKLTPEIKYMCTSCGGDAYIAYIPETIKRGKKKGEQRPGWNGLILPGERICLPCGIKRGLKFI